MKIASKIKNKKEIRAEHDTAHWLSFVQDDAPRNKQDKKRCFWRVRRTGDYALDHKLGESLGREALDYMRQNGAPYILNWIVWDMARAGEFEGVEDGFLSVFARTALAANFDVPANPPPAWFK